jgi:hypothetical protein
MYLYHVLFTFINIYGVDCQKKIESKGAELDLISRNTCRHVYTYMMKISPCVYIFDEIFPTDLSGAMIHTSLKDI